MDIILEVEYTGKFEIAIDADLVRICLFLCNRSLYIIVHCIRCSTKQHMWLWKCLEYQALVGSDSQGQRKLTGLLPSLR